MITFFSIKALAGWYGGVGVGVRAFTVRFSKLSVVGVKIDTLQLAANSIAGDLIIGYNHFFTNGFMLGAEIFGEYTDYSPKVTFFVPLPFTNLNLTETLKANIKYSTGLGFLFGYRTPKIVTFYWRLGVIGNRFTASSVSEFTGFPFDTVDAVKYVPGAQLGFGIWYPFSRRLSFRAEYTYTVYPERFFNFVVGVPGVVTSSINFTPFMQTNAFTAALIYHFN